MGNNSVGVIISSGIKTNSDKRTGKINNEYLEELKNEVKRILKDKGILILFASDFHLDESFKKIKDIKDFMQEWNDGIYEYSKGK
ncbi:MAG: hypothetical protein COS76_02520 [Candidatus Portnoybacteria bacterium CG06_land_8_20_14_3_00_39_12]|uniref:Uncharacterized protein n=3 Tax=Candidatus Portnoyibacteriota TaxID=1817913 RepID=A0A2M8KGY6_9BACT|nr:MAG: hypothetical protein AUJ33_01760 [Parcubacteria group bacterium CG1_02_40_25]PIU75115.1 MAG: hypothetical protein COS76_02520 [Candidatus Portnoybacteria bacterium CG06_land_8_20_14_3_00_39_12]PIZ70897.1 MAG: hypothetical protein COY09_01935 [Candidatus Portnoybacteria bacterium CG_4_10_14_0_2_um_filter_39_11]PJE59188.1 MAG: hypothetical protein COU83_00195 [Candidatus Portnoybacteria bacterium CG10_big_fil_rev_8_21_14_0_10_40_22]